MNRLMLGSLIVILLGASSCAKTSGNVVIHSSQDVAPLKHFAYVESCVPTITWNTVRLPNQPVVTYDVAVYQAVKTDLGGYAKGDGVFYREGYPDTFVTVEPALKRDTPYLWSIRVRLLDGKVSQWSNDSKTVKSPLPPASYSTHWHGFLTPNDC